jgi:hypothetical protein
MAKECLKGLGLFAVYRLFRKDYFKKLSKAATAKR